MRLHNNGFSLIEAMLAVVMMALVLAPLFLLEGTVFEGVTRITEQFKRQIFAHNFLYQARRDQPKNAREFNLEKKELLPPTTFKYQLRPVDTKPLTGQKNLYQETITLIPGDKAQPRESIVSFIFKPESQNAQ